MSDDSVQKARHSAAHLLAAAVKQLWPGAKNAIGPAIDSGFYQDFDMGDVKISENDLVAIEAKMKDILKTWGTFVVTEVSVEQARKDFADNPYKLELIEELATQGKTITENNPGHFLDLCKGGHSDDPQKELAHIKLLTIAGAYWRGNERNKMLTRIYGTAFLTEEKLKQHLAMLEEAKKRDHRTIGKELDLFTFSELVGPGLPLWTPKGTIVRNMLDDYVWELRKARGYEKVEIPHITKRELYEKSGHWAKFGEELFHIVTREGHEFAMKPMNCPHHTQIYDRMAHSYRELPLRYASTTMCYRDEQTGELHGLSRVRSFTQDDAHVFCRDGVQLKQECNKIWDIVDAFYAAVGFGPLSIRLSLRDPQQPKKYLGSTEVWNEMEQALRDLVKERGATAIEQVGEAAFYGPKIDFMATDSIGREWQVATIQVDRNQPEGFDLTCINEEGKKERIVMIHAAIMGSIERFLSILIEHHAGEFPLWIAPVQVSIITVADAHRDAAQTVLGRCRAADIRVELNDQPETVGKKIRAAVTQKIPYIVVIGDKEVESNTVAVRQRGSKDTTSMKLDTFIQQLAEKVRAKK